MKKYKGLNIPTGVTFRSKARLVHKDGGCNASTCASVTKGKCPNAEVSCQGCIFSMSNWKLRAEYWKSLQSDFNKEHPLLNNGDILLLSNDNYGIYLLGTIYGLLKYKDDHNTVAITLTEATYSEDKLTIKKLWQNKKSTALLTVSRIYDIMAGTTKPDWEAPFEMEVTMEEVCKKFGCNVKIVKGK